MHTVYTWDNLMHDACVCVCAHGYQPVFENLAWCRRAESPWELCAVQLEVKMRHFVLESQYPLMRMVSYFNLNPTLGSCGSRRSDGDKLRILFSALATK
ncbi:hypothetical protein PoB_002716600 [Plakobranchus ocellatus]|uniref:Uncharacterized protein n=1 Tax=Plakobranchus ocellatus TaxID=259542 RepID=A0AAV4A1Q8_9GAST|nr:hypothetical protein PoB_002716600 [Plakobranchus ocellatus]